MIRKFIIISLVLFLLISSVSASCTVFLEEDYGVTGDGSDEGYEIETAIAYATANKPCTIVFPAGKTILFGNRLTSGGNTEFDGNGSTLKMTDYWGNSSDEAGALRFGDGDWVHDLVFDGNREHVNTTIGSGSINNIQLADNVTFEDNEVKNTMAYGTYSWLDKNVLVRNNSFHDGNQYGFSPSGQIGNRCENITITDNTFKNLTQIAIKIRGTSNSTVKNNTITVLDGTGFTAIGIHFASSDAPTNNIIVDNNTITGDFTNVTGAASSISLHGDSTQLLIYESV